MDRAAHSVEGLRHQAIQFASALARGEKGRVAIIKDVVLDRIREVV